MIGLAEAPTECDELVHVFHFLRDFNFTFYSSRTVMWVSPTVLTRDAFSIRDRTRPFTCL